MTNRLWLLPAGFILAIGLIGCQNAELQEQFETRGQKFQHDLDQFAQLEQGRCEKLKEAGQNIDQQIEDDADRTAQNPEYAKAFFQQDIDHWNEKELDRQRQFNDLMKGDLDNMKETAIKMID